MASTPGGGEFVRTERIGGVVVVRLDRPKVNALNIAVLGEIEAVFNELDADPPGAVVLWGGDRIFAAGADIVELADPSSARAALGAFRSALDAVSGVRRTTVAALSGYALGGGLELALACDLRIAASDARLGLPEVSLGIIPGAGGTQRLARLIGPARAKDLVLSGRHVEAHEALALGIVNRVVDPVQLFDEALQLATALATGAVLAQALAKQAIDDGLQVSLAEGLDLERRLMEEALSTADARIGMESFAMNGPGKARFTGA